MADQTLSLNLTGGQVHRAERRCRICGELKPLNEFEHKGYGRRRTRCKACVNAARDPVDNRRRVKEWQQANRDKVRAAGRRRHERIRQDLVRWLASTLRGTRAYCKKKNVECSVTAAELGEMFERQGGKCALTGRDLVFGSKGQQRDSISIDRIEVGGSYSLTNVRLVTYQANMARGPFSDEELRDFCIAHLVTLGYTVSR